MIEPADFRELTELSASTPLAKALVHQAFSERLDDVEVQTAFHRNWNGGWRCRASVANRGVLEFALLMAGADVLLALPIPMPAGWRRRGVAASDGSRWTTTEAGDIVRCTATS